MVAAPRLIKTTLILALAMNASLALAGANSASAMGARDSYNNNTINISANNNSAMITAFQDASATFTSKNSNSFTFNPNQQVNGNNGLKGLFFNLSVLSVEWQAIADMTTYEIDPETLNLITKLTYTFVIHPTLENDTGNIQLPNGKYLLRMAVLLASAAAQRFSDVTTLNRKLLQSERLISWTQAVAEVRDGSATVQVTLPFRNVSSTTIMNNLLIELSPLKDNGINFMNNGKVEILPVRPTILSGPFLATREGHIIGNSGVSPLKASPRRRNTLSQYIAEAEIMHAAQRAKVPHYNSPRESAAAFAKEHSLKMITVSSPELRAVLAMDFTKRRGVKPFLDLLTTTDNATVKFYKTPLSAAVLCHLMDYRMQRDRRINYQPIHCFYNPTTYLRVAKYVHVGSIGEIPTENFRRRQLKFNVSGNYMVGRSHSDDTFSSISMNPFVFATRIVEALGLPSPINYNYSVNESDSRSQSENMILSNSAPMDVNTVTADIPLKRYLSCISVTPPPRIGSLEFDPKTPENGYYICNDKEEKGGTVTEEYAHIYERINESVMIDNLSAAAQSTNFSLRGDRDLLSFFYSIRLAQTPDHFMTFTSADAIYSAVTYLQATESATPGIVNIPVEMTKVAGGAPTFWEKYLGTYQENFIAAQ